MEDMLKLDVRYYDDEHRQLIEALPCGPAAEKLVHEGVFTTEQELLSYSLFTEQKDHDGWRNYAELAKRAPGRVGQFREYFDLSGGTVRSRFQGEHSTCKDMTERVGVGASLIVANRLFALTEADWCRIPESKKQKTLDFRLASDGHRFVQIEAKGAIVADVAIKGGSVSKHKGSVLEKKTEALRQGPDLNAIRLGVIASVPVHEHETATCWLVDPPGDRMDLDARKHRLMSRLTFYLRVLRCITSSSMLTALADRISALEAVEEYNSLDGVPLRSANQSRFRRSPRLLKNKTVIPLQRGQIQGRAFGRALPLQRDDGDEVLFVGVDDEVYRILAGQHFEEILNYHSGFEMPAPEHRTLEVVLPAERRPEMAIKQEAQWMRSKAEGRVQVLPSGIAIGLLRPPQAAKNQG